MAGKQTRSVEELAPETRASAGGLGLAIPNWALGQAPGASPRTRSGALKFTAPRSAQAQDSARFHVSLLTAEEVAAALNVSTKTVRRLISRGQLPAVRIGRAVRVRPEELNGYIQEHS